MNDIKIPDPHGRKKIPHPLEASSASENETEAAEPGEKVKVKFEKFVQLVATHNFEDILREHEKEDIIVSTNLLTDLANAHEELPQPTKKSPFVFLLGILIGIAIAYLIIRT